jgi:alkylated DNA repair dioxygenase AlkB
MERYAITFGEVAIIHNGSTELGKIRKEGFTFDELKLIKDKFGDKASLIDLSKNLPKDIKKDNLAGILVIRNGINLLFNRKKAADKFLKEQKSLNYDKKYYESRFDKTLNKRARYNIVFGDENIEPSDDFKVFSVKSFNDLKYLKKLRKRIGKIFGTKAVNLNAEGNYYFHKKSGIGFHGDAERKIVICLSLGDSSTLRYCWRKPGSSLLFGEPIDIQINHGDIYLMSEKATGFDWKSRSKYRLVHAAGHKSYLNHKE